MAKKHRRGPVLLAWSIFNGTAFKWPPLSDFAPKISLIRWEVEVDADHWQSKYPGLIYVDLKKKGTHGPKKHYNL